MLLVGPIVPDPANVTYSQTGAQGTSTYQYAVVAQSGSVTSLPAYTTVSLGNAALSGTIYNTISCTSVAGATYVIYRIFSVLQPIGKIASGLTTCTLNDTGLAVLDSTLPLPASNTTGLSATYDNPRLLTITANGVPRLGGFHYFMKACGWGESTAMQVVGDSTGADLNKWPFLLSSWLATNFPACAVRYRVWNDTNQTYDAPILLSAGGLGERYLLFDGAGNSGTAAPDQTAFDGAKDVDIRADIQVNAYTGVGRNQSMLARWDGGKHQIQFYINNNSGILVYGFNNGGDVFAVSTAPVPTSPARIVLRVTHQLDDGAAHNLVKFWTSTDRGATWIQLGTTITNVGATTISATAGTSQIGSTAASNMFAGRIYGVELWQSGKPINPLNLETYLINSPAHDTLAGSPTIDILNGSKSGANLIYYTGKQQVMFWPFSQSVFIFNNSHNEATSVGKTAWLDPLGTYLATVKPYLPTATFALMTQNPKLPGFSYKWQQDQRVRELRAWAPANGYALIDTYDAMVSDPRGLVALMNTDGVHPNDCCGAPLIMTVVRDTLLMSR
jgi:hypothetical protein